MREEINTSVFSAVFGPGKSSSSRLEVLQETCSIHSSVNSAYTKKRGAGVKTFTLATGVYIDNTPFHELLGILSRFSAESLPSGSKAVSSVRYLGTINRTITSVLRILNDRLAMLWRGSPEEDPLGIFQNGLLLMHEIAKSCQAFISLQYHLKSLFQPPPQSRNTRIVSTRSFSSSLNLTGKLLLSRVQGLQQMTLPQFQTRIDHFLVACICQLVDISNAKNLQPGSFRKCTQYAWNTDFNGRVESRYSFGGFRCVPCSIRVSKVFSSSGSGSSVTANGSDKSNPSSKDMNCSGSSVQSSFLRNKPLMSYSAGKVSALLAIRLSVLVPLYKASQTHCEHPQSMQALSMCINAALEHFLAAATKDINTHGIDASGVVYLFSQVQELRSWVISIKQEMALPVLLQDITTWIRVDEIVSLLAGTYEEMSGRSSAVSSTHRGDSRGPHRRPTAFPRHFRRNNNGSIQSDNADGPNRSGTRITFSGIVVDPTMYFIGGVCSQTAATINASYQFITGCSRQKLSSVVPLPAESAKKQAKERQIDDLLSGRVLLRDPRSENAGEHRDDAADDVISGNVVASLIPATNLNDSRPNSASSSAVLSLSSAAMRSSRGNKSPATFIQSYGLPLTYSRVFVRDTVLWSEFGTILARKHAKVTQPPGALTLPELKEWKARAKLVTELSTNWKDKYIKGCQSPRGDPVQQLKHIKVETWDM